MRIRSYLLAALLAAGLAPAAHSAPKIWLNVAGGGPSIPMGDFKSVDVGWNAAASLDFVMRGPFEVGGEIGAHSFGGDAALEQQYDDLFASAGVVPVQHVTLSYTSVPILARVRYALAGRAWGSPYLLGGAGVSLFNWKSTEIIPIRVEFPGTDTVRVTTSNGESDAMFAFQLGAGVSFKPTETVRVGLEGLYDHAGGTDLPDFDELGTPETHKVAPASFAIRGVLSFGFAGP